MSEISKIYLFLSQNKDWQKVMDANGDHEIIQAECRYYLKEHVDELDLEDVSKADNIISRFWNSINFNRVNQSLVNLDEREMDAMSEKIEVMEKFDEFFKSNIDKLFDDVVQVLVNNEHLTPYDITPEMKAVWLKSVKSSLLNALDVFLENGGKAAQLDDFLAGQLEDKFYPDPNNKNVVNLAVNRTTANVYIQRYITQRLEDFFPGENVVLGDLQSVVNDYIRNNITSDASLETVISGLEEAIENYFKSTELNDFNKYIVRKKIIEAITYQIAVDSAAHKFKCNYPDKFNAALDAFIEDKLASVNDTNWQTLIEKDSLATLLSEFKNTVGYRELEGTELADEVLSKITTTTVIIDNTDISSLEFPTTPISALALNTGKMKVEGIEGKNDANLRDVSISDLYESDATVILFQKEKKKIDVGDNWTDVENQMGHLCNIIVQSLINAGLDPSIVREAAEVVKQQYLNRGWLDLRSVNESYDAKDKDRAKIHDLMTQRRGEAAHQICCIENLNGKDAITYAIKVKDLMDDIINQYNTLAKDLPSSNKVETKVVYDKNDTTSVYSILSNTIPEKYLTAIMGAENIYRSVVDNAISMYANKQITTKEAMAKTIADGIINLYNNGAFKSITQQIDAKEKEKLNAALNSWVNVSTGLTQANASRSLSFYVQADGSIKFVNYTVTSWLSVWGADANSELQNDVATLKTQLESGFSEALSALNFTDQEKYNLFNAALYLALISQGSQYSTHNIKQFYDRVQAIYRNFLQNIANNKAPRSYITNYHNNCYIAGAATTWDSDMEDYNYLAKKLLDLGLENNDTKGDDDMIGLPIIDQNHLVSVVAGGCGGQIFLDNRGDNYDAYYYDGAMKNLITIYVEKYGNIIPADTIFEMFRRAQIAAVNVLAADMKLGDKSGDYALAGYETYGFGDGGGDEGSTNTLYDDKWYSIASVVLEVIAKMEEQLGWYMYNGGLA